MSKNAPLKTRKIVTVSEAKRSDKKRSTVAHGIQYDKSTDKFIVEFFHGRLDGKAIREHKSFPSLAEAKRALILFNASKIESVTESANSSFTMKECMEQYIIESRIRGRIEPTTESGYRVILNRLIKSPLADVKIGELRKTDIEDYILFAKQFTDLKNVTVNKDLDLIRTVLGYAVRKDYIESNPAHNVEKLKRERFEENPLSEEEIAVLREALLNTGDYTLIVPVFLCLFQGLRRGEALGLRWEQVSFEENVFFINETRTLVGGQIIDKSPKTESSYRYVFMNKWTREALLQAREHQIEQGFFGEYVAVTSKGERIYPTSLSTRFRKFQLKNGLRPIRLHGLRHTFATQAVKHGASINAVSGALGHSSIGTTMNIYVHSSKNASRAVNEILEDVF